MENFVKRVEEDVINEDEFIKEDKKIDKMIEESDTTVVRSQRKRKVTLESYDKYKKSCVTKNLAENEKKASLICSECGRKLKITNNYSCRCGNIYCIRHRFYDQHNCKFDYKTAAIAKLKAQNPKVVSKKIGDFQ